MRGAVLFGACLLASLRLAAEEKYPTQFKVLFADRIPGQTLGNLGSCSMRLEADGRIYTVGIQDTFHPCIVFAPGTVLWGRESHRFDEIIDLLDESGSKPKAHRYFVKDVQLTQ